MWLPVRSAALFACKKIDPSKNISSKRHLGLGLSSKNINALPFDSNLPCPGRNNLPQKAKKEKCSLDLILTNEEGLTGDVKVEGSLGCSDNEMVEFGILKGRRRVKSKLTALDFRRASLTIWGEVKKAKAQRELNLAKNVKENKKGFYGYIDNKRKTRKMWAHC
ncbi:hypothetical protein QYF61_002058 [Mycteria americana]|uniref:Uncharacterized protein n=1 Tax=Mycteria americana TaxID=33587 RepID=A0AAN7N1E3_MYCAM|nr:hypothetical protein QYF61_002058 [Mycteria americana]